MKKAIVITAAVCAALMAGAANAAPISAENRSIENYVRSRLIDPHMSKIRTGGELYRASAVIDGQAWTGWATDVSMNVRLAPGRRSGPHRRAVLLGVEGPIALNSDVRKFKRLD